MEIEFWQERWDNDQIGFHQEHINPYLAYFYGDKGLPHEKRQALKVFVPLCGKSRDMLWLARNGYPVFGVECSERAVDAFYQESAVHFRKATNEDGSLYQSVPDEATSLIEIYQGNFFSLQPQHLADVTDVFDRASLIALPGDMRREYVSKMAELLKPGTRVLLVTLSYDQSAMNGPPFSVSEENVNELYQEHFNIDKLLFKNIIDDEARFKQRGLSSLVETVYKLVRR